MPIYVHLISSEFLTVKFTHVCSIVSFRGGGGGGGGVGMSPPKTHISPLSNSSQIDFMFY